MIDGKVLVGAVITTVATGTGWIEQATEVGQLVATVVAILVGIATLVHTRNLIAKDKRERKDGEEGSGGGGGNTDHDLPK